MREYDQIGTSTSLTALTTKYAYDPLDQLLTVTDAKGNPTSAAYDTLGRMVTLVSKDTGLTEYRYDLNGNLKEKQTPNLRGQSRFITYAYDFNRLKTITYPNLTQVTYTYGSPMGAGDAAGNTAGRISKVTHEAGNETRTSRSPRQRQQDRDDAEPDVDDHRAAGSFRSRCSIRMTGSGACKT